MVQSLLNFIPTATGAAVVVASVALLAAGLLLWAVGAAWGRAFVTLLAVALGATLGMLVPRWQLWPINSMSAAVLGAVIFGVSAFLVERVWCGLVLGAVLVAWTTLGVWMNFAGDQPFAYRTAEEVQHLTPPQHARDVWDRLPESVRRVLPYAAATAVISAMAIALLWPRVAKVAAFSTLGVTMLFIAGLTLVALQRPQWLLLVPQQTSIQAAVLGALALLGMLVQWQLLPSRRRPQKAEESDGRAMQEPSPADFTRGKFV